MNRLQRTILRRGIFSRAVEISIEKYNFLLKIYEIGSYGNK